MVKTAKNASSRKLKKLERSKVKMKNTKDRLPKGQNVTDTTFKVKKIAIRDQVTQHKEGDVLSKNNLSFQDLIKRLSHPNTKAKLDALAGLKEVISQFSCKKTQLDFHVLFKKVPLLILDESKDVRRETNKLLKIIITQSNSLKSFYFMLHSHMVCGLTHINRVVREDGIYFLGTLIEHAGVLCVDSVPEILPILLNQISRSESTKRSLITHLEAKYISDTWREKVISKISALLSLVLKHYKDQYKKPEPPIQRNLEELTLINGVRYFDPPIRLSRIDLTNRFDFFNKINSLTPYQQQKFDMKEFASSLIPLLFELAIELYPVEKSYLNEEDTSADISIEGSVILKDMANIIYCLWNILTEPEACLSENPSQIGCWFKNKFGKVFMKTLIYDRYPYIVLTGKEKLYLTEQNILLTKLIIILTNVDEWNLPISFFKNIHRLSDKFTFEEWKLYFSCVELIVVKRTEHTEPILSNVHRLTTDPNNFVSSRATEFFYKIVMDDRLASVRSSRVFKLWMHDILGKLATTQVSERDIIMVLDLAKRNMSNFSELLEIAMESILENLPSLGVKCDLYSQQRNRERIAGLIWFIRCWDDRLKNYIITGINNNYWGVSLTNQIKYLFIQRFGEDVLRIHT